MKSIVALAIVLIALVAVDHFDLLQTSESYPPALNRLIVAIREGDFSVLAANREPNNAMSAPATVDPPEPVNRTLYRWKNEQGVWIISEIPPPQGLYSIFTLKTDRPTPIDNGAATTLKVPRQSPGEAELKRQARCRYAVEQIDNYKNKMRFGGPSETISHWQNALDNYRRLALQSCSDIERSK